MLDLIDPIIILTFIYDYYVHKYISSNVIIYNDFLMIGVNIWVCMYRLSPNPNLLQSYVPMERIWQTHFLDDTALIVWILKG